MLQNGKIEGYHIFFVVDGEEVKGLCSGIKVPASFLFTFLGTGTNVYWVVGT